MVMRAKERGKSECQSVMGWIEVETLPHAKAGLRPHGSSQESV